MQMSTVQAAMLLYLGKTTSSLMIQDLKRHVFFNQKKFDLSWWILWMEYEETRIM